VWYLLYFQEFRRILACWYKLIFSFPYRGCLTCTCSLIGTVLTTIQARSNVMFDHFTIGLFAFWLLFYFCLLLCYTNHQFCHWIILSYFQPGVSKQRQWFSWQFSALHMMNFVWCLPYFQEFIFMTGLLCSTGQSPGPLKQLKLIYALNNTRYKLTPEFPLQICRHYICAFLPFISEQCWPAS
jgi:hypothetical protein